MAEPIRVLHFADVHIGMETYGKTDPETGLSTRITDFLRRMDEMIEYAREGDVDLVIFAGDAFKTRTPNPTYQREFAWRIRDLAELAPVVMLVGNHDLPPNEVKASSIEIYDTLSVANVYVADEYAVERIPTKRGDVIVGAAPYPIRSRLARHIDDTSVTIRDMDLSMERALSTIIEDLAKEAEALDAGDSIPRILTAHFTVSGASVSLGSERKVMLGRDVKVPLYLLADKAWDYVALGHIHRHQNLTADRPDLPPVVYSGSIERIDFGEENEPKGFCWVEVERGQADWEYVQVKARPMVTLRADCREDVNPNRTIRELISQYQLQEAIVRLIIDLTPETNSLLSDSAIKDDLRRAGVFYIAGINRSIERPERARLGMNPEELTHDQLLRQYFRSKGKIASQIDILLEAAEPIFDPSKRESEF